MLEVLISLPVMVVGLIMPVLSLQYEQHDQAGFTKLYQRSVNLLWIMAAPMIVGGWLLAQPLMLLIAGPNYTSDPVVLGQLFRILIFAVAAIFIGTLTGYVVVAVNKQRTIIAGYAFVAVTAFTGYLWLIPQYSYFGAAWVTVYSETAMMLIAIAVIYQATKALPSLAGLLRITLAASIMGVGVYWMQSWPLLLVIALGTLLYATALLAVKGITADELKTVLKHG